MFEIGCDIFLSWDQQDLIGKQCHISATSFFHALVVPSVNFLGPLSIGLHNFGVSLVLDLSVNTLGSNTKYTPK